jgi:hypothetical protein
MAQAGKVLSGHGHVFCFEEPSRDPTGETPVPRGMGVPPMSDETRSKTKDRAMGGTASRPSFLETGRFPLE